MGRCGNGRCGVSVEGLEREVVWNGRLDWLGWTCCRLEMSGFLVMNFVKTAIWKNWRLALYRGKAYTMSRNDSCLTHKTVV